MSSLGSSNGELTFLDILSIISFCVGLQNLDLNIDQNDMDNQTREIDKRASELVNNAIAEIHQHLEKQDQKINKILEVLKVEAYQKTVEND